jgi:hypothetical protein
LPTDELMPRITRFRYRNIFFLEALPFADDGLRFEGAREAATFAGHIIDAYVGLSYSLVRVPAFGHLQPSASR